MFTPRPRRLTWSKASAAGAAEASGTSKIIHMTKKSPSAGALRESILVIDIRTSFPFPVSEAP
jgi:hypothetical protein